MTKTDKEETTMQDEYKWAFREITFDDKGCKRGDKIPSVRIVQEWLALNNFAVAIDGAYGPATEKAVNAFQGKAGLPQDGIVGKATFEALTAPMRRVLVPITPSPISLGKSVVEYAEQHLAEHPREVGGQNRGPWVRLYMEGNQGTDWAWCAGFVCFLLRQGCDSLAIAPPLKPTFSCDELANRARTNGSFISGKHLTNPTAELAPGAIFIHRKSDTDWTHTGIVTEVNGETFATIEGNTNDSGDREGYEVCCRIRSFQNMDFIKL